MDYRPTNAELVRAADEHLDATLRRFDEGLRPIWESQAELGKTLMSLAASALVLSISVAQFALDKIKNPRAIWLLPSAWILFAVTVLIGASRQAWLGQAQSLRAGVEAQRGQIRAQLWNLKVGDDFAQRFDAILSEAVSKASAQPDHGVRVFDRLTKSMYWSFTIGLIALLSFAVGNLSI